MDGSIKHPKGIVEDLLVQVDKFKVPMDFVVLEIKRALLRHKEHMIFLGGPFMATTKTMIDVQSGRLAMTLLGETVQLKVCDLLHILLLLLIINALLWIVLICMCLTFLFRKKRS